MGEQTEHDSDRRVVFGILLLIIASLALILRELVSWLSAGKMDSGTIARTLGAIGTLTLALITYRSLRSASQQHQSELNEMKEHRDVLEDQIGEMKEHREVLENQFDEMRKEHEKDVYIDFYKNAIQPVTEVLKSNQERLESGDYGWRKDLGTAFKPVEDSIALRDFKKQRFMNEFDLSSKISDYDELVEELDKCADRFARALRDPVKMSNINKLRDLDEKERVEFVDILIRCVINPSERESIFEGNDLPDSDTSVDIAELGWDQRVFSSTSRGDSMSKYSISRADEFEEEAIAFRNAKDNLDEMTASLISEIENIESEIYNEYGMTFSRADQ